MQRLYRLGIVLILLSGCRASAPASVDSGSPPIPRIAIEKHRLGNGLDVYSLQDNSSPNVSIQVWYRVGSKDDPDHRTGPAEDRARAALGSPDGSLQIATSAEVSASAARRVSSLLPTYFTDLQCARTGAHM